MKDKIIGVRFKKTGKLYYYDFYDNKLKIGDSVIANTQRGEELGRIVKIIDSKSIKDKIEADKKIKIASKDDLNKYKVNEINAKEALEFCRKEVKKQDLNMKLLTAEYTLDGSKLTIYFTSEDRVDFRDLVKTLAFKYKTRIELRQVGPRDEVKSYPNLGMCGKEVCCRTFLQDFEPVTIKMAKEQGLQINMAKLSGACGKLMCCLKYEENSYKENLEKLPKIGTIVKVEGQNQSAKVTSLDILKMMVKVKFGTTKDDERFETYNVNKLKWNNKEQNE